MKIVFTMRSGRKHRYIVPDTDNTDFVEESRRILSDSKYVTFDFRIKNKKSKVIFNVSEIETVEYE